VAVAESDELLRLIDALPEGKRQPNLVFAAARWNGISANTNAFASHVIERWDRVRATVLARSTQTNEPARCATLLFALERIQGPIALIEVGSSAGLCLIPDRYDYRFTVGTAEHRLVSVAGHHALSIECVVEGTRPPRALPDIRWRLGVDVDPVNLGDDDQYAWLETLVWPEHDRRRERLRLARTEWSADPPDVVVGDVLGDLRSLARDVPRGLTTVIMHSAVLAYLPPDARVRATESIRAVSDHWISLEGADVVPQAATALPEAARRSGDLVLALDGVPIGIAAPHGGRFTALGG